MRYGVMNRLILYLMFSGGIGASAAPLATIPFAPSRGDRVMVPVSLNESNGLAFMLDSGFTMTMVHPTLAQDLALRRSGEITIQGIAGEEQAPTYAGATFNLGGITYTPRRVAALNSESNRRRRDGILGSGVFRQFVVELDFQRRELRLHAPTNFTYTGKGEVVPLRFRRSSSTPLVAGSIRSTNGNTAAAEFEIDTGCDSGLCLGQDFVEQHQLLARGNTQASEKFGVGGGTQTRSGTLPHVQLGNLRIEKPQTDFFLQGSPVDSGLAGHIGIGVLKHYKVIFDYSRRQMILEPISR